MEQPVPAARDDLGTDALLIAAQIAFFVSLVVPVTTLSAWWTDGRRRGGWDLAVSGATAVAALLGYVVARTQWTETGGLGVLMLVSGAASLLTFGALLVASAPGPRAKKRRWSINPAKDRRYLAARRQVLDILVQRKVAGDLDADTRKRMGQMPLGSGHELDRTSTS